MVGVDDGQGGLVLVIGHGHHIGHLDQVWLGEAANVLEARHGEAPDDALGAANQDVIVTNTDATGTRGDTIII